MRATRMLTPREREAQRDEDEQEASLYEWLRNCVMTRQALSFEEARRIYYHVRATKEVNLIDQRQHAGGRPLYSANSEKLDEDEAAFSLTSPAMPMFALSTYDTLKAGFEHAIFLGLKPTIHVYPLSDKKH